MKKSSRLVYVLSLGLVAFLPSVPAAPPSAVPMRPTQLGPMQPHPPMQPFFHLTCRAQGTPVEFPNDIVLINNGPATLPAGTKVHWSMVAPAYQGDYTFTAPLSTTKVVFVNGVLGAGVAAGTPCTVHVVK